MPDKTTIDRLKALWRTHAHAIGAFSAERVGAVFDHLCTYYSEPHRRYHTLAHLDTLFTIVEGYGATLHEPLHVAYAAWFHDVIYDPRARDNEAMSAARAERYLTFLGAEPTLIEQTSALIRATASHRAGAADADDRLFLDADMAILGAPRADYAAYAAGVRAEYAWLGAADWAAGRSTFLATMTNSPRLFHTDPFETSFAEQARANMAWEQEELRRP